MRLHALTRPPLNALTPRTERETRRDAFDWIEGPTFGHRKRPRLDRLAWIATAALLFALYLFVRNP